MFSCKRTPHWVGVRVVILPCLASFLTCLGTAQVPSLLNVQGRLVVRGDSFSGTGQFKFALVNTDSSSVFWRNAADGTGDGEPDTSVALPVNRGIYSVALGDISLGNMSAVPASVFTNNAVFLRTWFSDGVTGFQRLVPDQRITAVGYALMAANVSDGAITKEKLSQELATQMSAFTAVSSDPQDTALGSSGYQVFMTVAAPSWMNGAATGAPTARSGHAAVWTGEELLVWGGDVGQGNLSSSGYAYQPGSDQWKVLSPLNAPSSRSGHSAVWTGSEMIISGGVASVGYASGGGRFDPSSQNWTVLPSSGAPTGRQGHAVAWTGSRMVVWGGLDNTGLLSDGALFDPVLNLWTPLAAGNPPSPRHSATGIWTGGRFIIWGGQGTAAPLNTGAQLVFTSGLPESGWQTISTSGAPSARYGHTAVWTGQRMIVWGGRSGSGLAADGAAYDPGTDTWSALPNTNAPSAREGHSSIWTGVEMIVVGGENESGVLATGAAYDPIANKWRSLTNPGAPVARSGATAVWSGAEILIFGGQANGQRVAALQKLNPQPAWYFYRKP